MSAHRTNQRKTPWRTVEGPILIVDDDLDEARLAKRALESAQPNPAVGVRICSSGKDFLAYLEGKGAYEDRVAHPLPSLVLLDLKMPEMDGFEVLAWVKGQTRYAHIPIVILSGMENPEGLKRAYSLQARSYLFKPINMDSFRDVLTSLNIAL